MFSADSCTGTPVVGHIHMLPEKVLPFAVKILKQLNKLNHI